MEYQPPPAFGPPESRVGPLRPDEVWALSAGPASHRGVLGAGPSALPPKRWRAMVVGAVAVLTLVATGLIAFVWANSSSPRVRRTIELPGSAGSYQLIRPIDPATAQAAVGNQLGALTDALGSAKIGVYGPSSMARGTAAGSTLLFIGFNAADSARLSSLLSSTGSARVVEQVMSGAGTEPGKAISPGPLGGALECAPTAQAGTSFTVCTWADRDTLALVMQVGRVDVDAAGALTLQFRETAEH